ncbi:N-acetylmuramidase/lysin [Streptococcus dysgalactiae]|nr:N-acetylmuramidase/lysin [Streptococcus dysgalactiae]
MTATGTIEIFNVSHTGYSIKVSGASVDGGFKGMFFPTWSRKEYYSEEWKTVTDRDDIFWYRGVEWGGNWYCTINVSDHNYDAGEYFTHIYFYRGDGDLVGLAARTIVVPDPPKKTRKRVAMQFIGGLAFMIDVGISSFALLRDGRRSTTLIVQKVEKSSLVRLLKH